MSIKNRITKLESIEGAGRQIQTDPERHERSMVAFCEAFNCTREEADEFFRKVSEDVRNETRQHKNK